MQLDDTKTQQLFNQIITIIHDARSRVVQTINHQMVAAYFHIGRLLVEHEQEGNERAGYGEGKLAQLSRQLSQQFGKGFSLTNLQHMRKFYLVYQKQQTPSVISPNTNLSESPITFPLSWSHYLILMRMNEDERSFYQKEAEENRWSVRELQRQYDAALFERLTLSKDKQRLKQSSQQEKQLTAPQDIIKDPYILEFLDLQEQPTYSESQLEQAIIDKLEHFLLELGKGFAFVGRQQRLSFEEEHFFVDLVFYNRLLRCFVLIDLKIGKLKHQDIGQIQMYVNYYDRFVKTDEENPTIGIILCKEKKDTLVEITLPEDNQQIYASKYEFYLPSKEELRKQIEEM